MSKRHGSLNFISSETTTFIEVTMLFRIFNEYLLQCLILLTVWCWSSRSSVIRYNTEEDKDVSQIRIRHHKNKNQNMTRHHHNNNTGE